MSVHPMRAGGAPRPARHRETGAAGGWRAIRSLAVGSMPPTSTAVISGANRSCSTQAATSSLVLVDGLAVTGREDHVQLIQCAESRKELPKRGNRAAALRQKVQDVGVKRQPPCSHDGHERHTDDANHHGRTLTSRPRDDRGD